MNNAHAESQLADNCTELEVTFSPPLHLQRRLWILDILRRENIVDVLDIGCGEGSLLSTLCQAAPWLPPSANAESGDDFNWLRLSHVRGLDISDHDLQFAVKSITPPTQEDETQFVFRTPRWEELGAQIWKGGLEIINKDFVNAQCLVSTEVIEHLPPSILPAFAPVLFGIYHPTYLLVTTPSYTFNARFTSPDAPSSARSGFLDPTQRTDRVFRHHDHKFEWTDEEFTEWCQTVAEAWGYEILVRDNVGLPMQNDPFGRVFNGATSVVCFKRKDDEDTHDLWRENKGRKELEDLKLDGPKHDLLANYHHLPHSSSSKPRPSSEIWTAVVEMMESYPTTILRFEDLWFQSRTIPVLCGGHLDALSDAIYSVPDILRIEEEAMSPGGTVRRSAKRAEWNVRLVQGLGGGAALDLSSVGMGVGETSLDYIVPGNDWCPSEVDSDEDDASTASASEWSAGADGDISREGSDEEEDQETDDPSDLETPATIAWSKSTWSTPASTPAAFGTSGEDAQMSHDGKETWDHVESEGWGSSAGSRGGWEADQSHWTVSE